MPIRFASRLAAFAALVLAACSSSSSDTGNNADADHIADTGQFADADHFDAPPPPDTATNDTATNDSSSSDSSSTDSATTDSTTTDGDGGSAGCTASGGAVTTSLCCAGSGDFPNTCLIGACGCAPSSSHEVKVCNCPTGKCWDGSACVVAG
jgi:hypothetical protein